ncbi:MAG: thioesterase family protein [Pseudomonadota bacterium]
MKFHAQRRIEWGDCDSAGIVYYPNYFRWMDQVFHELARAEGFDQRTLFRDFDMMITPSIGAGGDFVSPASFGDVMDISVWFAKLGHTSMVIRYLLAVDGRAIVHGEERRVFGHGDASGLKTAAIPAALRSKMETYLEEGE